MIVEGLTVVTRGRSMLALLQFFCFYSDVLLKHAQSQKNVKKKEVP